MSNLRIAITSVVLSTLLVGLVTWIGRGVITGHWVPYVLE